MSSRVHLSEAAEQYIAHTLCASPDCEYLVHSAPSSIATLTGLFCCLKCQGRHEGADWGSQGKRHFKHCERREASPTAIRAHPGRTVVPLELLSPEIPPSPNPDSGDAKVVPAAEGDEGAVAGDDDVVACIGTELVSTEPWSEIRDDFLYCLACMKYATECHLESLGHQRRLAIFLEELRRPRSEGDNAFGEAALALLPSTSKWEQRTPRRHPQQGGRGGRQQRAKSIGRGSQIERFFLENDFLDLDAGVGREGCCDDWWQGGLASLTNGGRDDLEVMTPNVSTAWQRTLYREWELLANPALRSLQDIRINTSSKLFEAGQTVTVCADFLEYADDPEIDGCENSGFLVARSGDCAHILFVGQPGTSEEGWAFAEIGQIDPAAMSVSEPAFARTRRGWMPVSSLLPAS